MPLFDNLLDRVADFIPVLLSLTVHEWAHAWTAWKLGDDTAKQLGRVSLNPIDHIDPVGTLLLPLLGIPFGWAKPVPFNPVRFRTNVPMTTGMLLVAAAGPISNLVLAALGCVALVAMSHWDGGQSLGQEVGGSYTVVFQFVQLLVLINILLATFNLLPIPPLDGSRIVDALMPASLRPGWNSFVALGPALLIAVFLLPIVTDFNLLAWPMHLAQQLIDWAITV